MGSGEEGKGEGVREWWGIGEGDEEDWRRDGKVSDKHCYECAFHCSLCLVSGDEHVRVVKVNLLEETAKAHLHNNSFMLPVSLGWLYGVLHLPEGFMEREDAALSPPSAVQVKHQLKTLWESTHSTQHTCHVMNCLRTCSMYLTWDILCEIISRKTWNVFTLWWSDLQGTVLHAHTIIAMSRNSHMSHVPKMSCDNHDSHVTAMSDIL